MNNEFNNKDKEQNQPLNVQNISKEINTNQQNIIIKRNNIPANEIKSKPNKRKLSVENTIKPQSFFQKYKRSLIHRKFKKNKNEILSGITVSLAQIPEAIAFSITATVSPIVGLNGAFIMSLITSVFGGRPGMVSGATGALAVVQGPLVIKYGEDVLFAAMIACGIIQMLIAVCGGGKLIRLVPESVMLGFLNGLAIVIGMAQISSFREICDSKDPNNCDFITGMKLLYMIIMNVLGFLFIVFAPMIPKIGEYLPGPLLAITISTIVNQYCNLDTKTVGDISSVKGQFPTIHLPDITLTFSMFFIIVRKGLEFALIGLIETLMTLQIIDEFTRTKGNKKMEGIAQGVGNFISGWTASLGGCAMIGQSQINVHHGGVKRLSTITASIGIFIIIIAASSLIEIIPVASLTALMFVVVYKTFYWKTFLLFKRLSVFELFIVFLVTVITIIFDLAIAVIIGIIISGMVYVWERGFDIRCETHLDTDGVKTKKFYQFEGDLFFSSVHSFIDRFRYQEDPDLIYIDCKGLKFIDFSGVDALKKVIKKYKDYNKVVKIVNLQEESEKLIRKTKLIKNENLENDPNQLIEYKNNQFYLFYIL